MARGTCADYLFIDGANSYDRIEKRRMPSRRQGVRRVPAATGGPSRAAAVRDDPNFHHTPRRFEALEKAIEADTPTARRERRRRSISPAHKAMTATLIDLQARGLIPERITTTTPNSTTSCSMPRQARASA